MALLQQARLRPRRPQEIRTRLPQARRTCHHATECQQQRMRLVPQRRRARLPAHLSPSLALAQLWAIAQRVWRWRLWRSPRWCPQQCLLSLGLAAAARSAASLAAAPAARASNPLYSQRWRPPLCMPSSVPAAAAHSEGSSAAKQEAAAAVHPLRGRVPRCWGPERWVRVLVRRAGPARRQRLRRRPPRQGASLRLIRPLPAQARPHTRAQGRSLVQCGRRAVRSMRCCGLERPLPRLRRGLRAGRRRRAARWGAFLPSLRPPRLWRCAASCRHLDRLMAERC